MSDRTGGLRSEPLVIGTSWAPRLYATDIPGSSARREFVRWTLHLSIQCATTEILLARRLGSSAPVRLRWRSEANHVCTVVAGAIDTDDTFDPTTVALHGNWLGASTGTLLHIAAEPPWPLSVELWCIAKSDTINSHGRWLVDQGLRQFVPAAYSSLCAPTTDA